MTLPTATLARTHDVFNQSTPWADVNLFTTNQPLQDAHRLPQPQLQRFRIQPDAAAFATGGDQPVLLAHKVHNFNQMVLRHMQILRNFRNRIRHIPGLGDVH